MRPRRPGDEELSAVARRRLALIGQELDLLGQVSPERGSAAEPEVSLQPGSAPVFGASQEPAAEALRPGAVIAPAGRHRADPATTRRGPLRSWTAWVPASLRGRVQLAPQHVALVAVVVALALAVTTWWVLRAVGEPSTEDAWAAPSAADGGLVADPSTSGSVPPQDPPDDPAAASSAASSAASPAASGSTPPDGGADSDGIVVVHVAGKVRRPGIVTLPLGSRVADAVEAAGGARPRVDLSSVNLARVLVDGEQVLVGEEAAVPPTSTAAPGSPAESGSGAGLVNLNTATAAELETLNGVGPVTAQAILAWRDEHGRFTAIEELLEVSGIGEKTLAQLAPQLTL